MINNEKMQIALKSYKEAFSERWVDEKFKWEAVKWFQNHWDINAENFSELNKLKNYLEEEVILWNQ